MLGCRPTTYFYAWVLLAHAFTAVVFEIIVRAPFQDYWVRRLSRVVLSIWNRYRCTTDRRFENEVTLILNKINNLWDSEFCVPTSDHFEPFFLKIANLLLQPVSDRREVSSFLHVPYCTGGNVNDKRDLALFIVLQVEETPYRDSAGTRCEVDLRANSCNLPSTSSVFPA